MLNGPKNGLTYTQNDREKWQNTFTMIVSASLHVLVTEKVQQASTITLAPRCSHASDSPGPAMVEFLSDPFIPCNLRPKYLKTGGVYPFFTTCSMRPEGGPLGQAAKPRPNGCGPLPLPRGASHPAFLGGWRGHVVPNPQKSYLRLVWHQYVVGGGCGWFLSLALTIFSPLSCYSSPFYNHQLEKCAQAPAAVRPATAHARWEAATPPVACLCPSRGSA